MIDTKILIIGGVVVVVLVIVLVLVLRKKKGTSEKKESFYPCGGCRSWGIKSCIDRDLFRQMYDSGVLTENTIDPNQKANWAGDQPEGDNYYQYQAGVGKKTCGGGWN